MRWIPWCVSVLALAGASYSGLLLLDAGVALDNARSEVGRLRERSAFALELIRREWVGKSVSSVEELFQEAKRRGLVVSVDGTSFLIDDVKFEVDAERVRDVRYID